MSKRILTLTIILGLGAALALLWLFDLSPIPSYAAAVRTVCPSGPPMCDYATIQDAIDAAQAGDEIKVAAGTYSDLVTRPRPLGYGSTGILTQVLYISKTLTLRGGYAAGDWTTPDSAAHPTIINAQGQGRGIAIIGGIAVTIQGVQVTGGNATGQGGLGRSDAGGGIYALQATVTLADSAIQGSTATHYGGGIFIHESVAAFLVNNTILSNTVTFTATGPSNFGWGGGLMLSNSPRARLIANSFSGNHAGVAGGGIYGHSSVSATLSSNVIASNTARVGGGMYLNKSNYVKIGSGAGTEGNTLAANTAEGEGGGLYLFNSSDIILSDNTIVSNTANTDGGGLFLVAISSIVVSNNRFEANTAGGKGGGLYLLEGKLTTHLLENTFISNVAGYGGGLYLENSSNVTARNTIIAANRAFTEAGGLYINKVSPRLLHTTLADNLGSSGLYAVAGNGAHSTLALTNTIVSGHNIGISIAGGCTATVAGILWHNTPLTLTYPVSAVVTVNAQYNGNPNFADPLGGDYHLDFGSAAIDKGLTTSVKIDIDGDSRPSGPLPDLGADEWNGVWKVYLPTVSASRSP